MQNKQQPTPTMIVVSNRLPFVLKRDEDGNLTRKASAGGLVTAVAPVVVECKGLWVGWPGVHLENPDEPIPESSPDAKGPTAGLMAKQVVPVHVERNDLEKYYNGCCNSAFWPLFHSMPDRAVFNFQHWESYCRVNQTFAEKTVASVRKLQLDEGNKRTPLVWIHDFHLMVAANTIRQSMEDDPTLKCSLGFFLHIPFPPYDIFRIFPWDDEILQGLLGHDLVGFHIESYALNFIDCCQQRLGCRVDKDRMLVEHGGRTVRVRALPIGIPFNRFVTLAKESQPFVRQNPDQKLVLGVDRLDYTKGLLNRVRSIERLLELYPEHKEKIIFLQVAVPSRTDVEEYQILKEELDQEVGRINGRFSNPNWSPIRYIYRSLGQDELASYYRAADVALVTPLRDGMNLVAKEFVACQTEDPGVLILSPFTGAGETMLESLLVNPYETTEMANAINRAISMPEDERQVRMNLLRKREKQNDVHYWLQSFLRAMGTVMTGDQNDDFNSTIEPFKVEDFDLWMSRYVDDTSKLALLLDYDGTLAPIASHPDLALMPTETKRVLERLCNISDVHIAIVSGRKVENVKEMVGIDKITYAGSHGLEIIHPDGTKFIHPGPQQYAAKMEELKTRLVNELQRDGAWVENKGFVLTYHVRKVPNHLRGDLLKQATQLIVEYGFKPGNALCAVEAKPPVVWDKGRASIHILRTTFGVDWNERVRVIYAGDDTTDEDAIAQLKGLAFTFRVTSHHRRIRTAAKRRLPGTDSVLMLLKWIERHVGRRSARPTPSVSPTLTPSSSFCDYVPSTVIETNTTDCFVPAIANSANMPAPKVANSETPLPSSIVALNGLSDLLTAKPKYEVDAC
ncbi:trehalose-6-phosphate synthase-like [Styela clava]